MMIFITILLVIAAIFIVPILAFGCGWVIGLFIKITIGSFIVEGLKLVGINIPLDSLPLFFAVLNTIAMFFHSYTSAGTSNLFKNKYSWN